jgi:hypothetical protein
VDNPNKITEFREPEWVFPYQGMEIGDSFFMPTVRPAYAHYIIDLTSKKVGIRVKTYTMVDDGVLGVRAWRVA